MGLPLALKAHTQGNLELAKEQYERTLENNGTDSIIYQNFGSLLKTLQQFDYSEKIYLDGLKLYPTHIGILTNLANLYREIKPVSALQKYKDLLSLHLDQGKTFRDDKVKAVLIDIVNLTRELGLCNIAFLLIARSLDVYPDDPVLLTNLMLLLGSNTFSIQYTDLTSFLKPQIESYIDTVDIYVRLQILFALAMNEVHKNKSSPALHFFDRAFDCAHQIISSNSPHSEKARNLLTVHSWNAGCMILKSQNYERGWKLFEYGLQTPCHGKQRWQRSLSKPFSSSQLALWRGESLKNKSLLLLEEQAVGDVLMFASLLHSLLIEAEQISLFLSDRLLTIVHRAYNDEIKLGKLKIYSRSDYHSGALSVSHFNYQSPIGSICQYRFISPHDYAPRVPCLIADPNQVLQLTSKYQQTNHDIKTIGISWRGGGKGPRVAQKSIDEELFFNFLLSFKGFRFINLQYGNCKSVVSKWRSKGLDIVHDDDINPLKDMDLWLSQVSICDAVLSIANTTIHGAGGLNIPTICLLSTYADWRWLDDPVVTRSYWYPSVGIARQCPSNGWSPALQLTRDWFALGCPFPTGPTHL